MKKRIFVQMALLGSLFTLLLSGCGKSGNGDANLNPDSALSTQLQLTLDAYDIPAIAVITVDENRTVEQAAVGKRRVGASSEVTVSDHWNIGSLTKSMTATLAASMVEQGFLEWNTTLGELFGEFADTMQPRYHSVTLVELLSHTAGLPADDARLWEDFLDSTKSAAMQRYAFTQEALAFESPYAQGVFRYSNINYVIACAMLEKSSGMAFETLIQTYLFDPLVMNSSAIGFDRLNETISGHVWQDGAWVVKAPDVIDPDTAKIVAPAGSRTYVTLEDMKRYLQAHLRAMRGHGDSELMAPEQFDRLHTPVSVVDEDLNYALGWFTEGDYGLQHTGSNGRWFAAAFVNAQTGLAYFVVVNGYKPGIEQAVFETMQLLIARNGNPTEK